MTHLQKRKITNVIALSVSVMCAALGLLLLFIILFDVLKEGIGSLSLKLFTENPAPPGREGGLKGAFLGQGLITLLAAMAGIPIGVLGGTFLAEYGRNSKFAKFLGSLSDMAMSIPSIVIGAFVYAILVRPMQDFNGWAGATALAIIILPVIVRTTADMMSLVPWTLREAAFALGASYHKVIISIVWRAALSGIATGILLALARVAGETAPLLFTSFNSNFFQLNLNHAIPSLTVSIYQYAASPYESWVRMTWAAAFIVTVLVLMLNIMGRIVVRFQTKGKS
jgi:phosphate transport system permease protein